MGPYNFSIRKAGNQSQMDIKKEKENAKAKG